MKSLQFILTFICVSIYGNAILAQSDAISTPINYDNYKEFCAILHNGKPIGERWNTSSELSLMEGARGELTVATVDRKGDNYSPIAPVGFKLGIKNHRTNALWMYSEETFFKIDVQKVLKECEYGDQLIFITVDKKYQLPKHILRINAGC